MLHIFVSSKPGQVKPGATGKPVPGYEARVVDEAYRPLPPGHAGLLAVKGPTGCRYWNRPERQREYVRDGWNIPGDVYVEDPDGFFVYQCRADDMIVSGGYKIAGPELETALLEHPGVQECAVVASPDATRGSIAKAFVVAENRNQYRTRVRVRAAGFCEGAARTVQISEGGRIRFRASED